MRANILDYIKWRGDLSFFQNPPDGVGTLSFSALAYIRFSERVTQRLKEPAASAPPENEKQNEAVGKQPRFFMSGC